MEEQTRYLILAVISGNVELSKLILKHIQSESINRTALNQLMMSNLLKCMTSLTVACGTDNLKMVVLLIKHKESVLMMFEVTPLYVAAMSGHFEVVEYLTVKV